MFKMADYSGFRLSRINEPRFSHLWLILAWPAYFLLYFLTERFIPVERCASIHCWLDDVIPFCEYFAIAYCFWFAFVFFSLLYFLLFDTVGFRRLQTFIIVTQVVAMIIYIALPSRQDLRPEVFPRDNFFTHLMAAIYSVDTNTGVCPSLHAAYSIGIASAWRKKTDAPAALKIFVIFAAVMICASVCFVKQHSALDVLAALPLCLLAEWIAFGKSYWLPRLRRRKEPAAAAPGAGGRDQS